MILAWLAERKEELAREKVKERYKSGYKYAAMELLKHQNTERVEQNIECARHFGDYDEFEQGCEDALSDYLIRVGPDSEVVSILADLRAVQSFIKKDSEYCPDYSVTKKIYIQRIQNVIDKYTVA